jgi:pseudouridine-5'-phosphate glycosidase
VEVLVPVGPVLADEVARALEQGAPVVALESTIVSHGLPRPRNLEVAREVEKIVREHGAVPATIAVLDGVPRIGLDDEQLSRIAESSDVRKLGVRDLPVAAAAGIDGATTVASTSVLAAGAGIRVFATGGLGGVHRDAATTWDESADLYTLGATELVVVCSGVKSILDVPATLERLESLGVTVLGYGSSTFPGFYLRSSGHELDWTVESPDEVAAVLSARGALGLPAAAVVVANPLPEDEQLDPALHEEVLRRGLDALAEEGIAGKDVTPFLLDLFHRETDGASLDVNERLIRRNAQLAARIAVACAKP